MPPKRKRKPTGNPRSSGGGGPTKTTDNKHHRRVKKVNTRRHRTQQKHVHGSAENSKSCNDVVDIGFAKHVRISDLEWYRFSKHAINGYVHVPAGIPYMTRNCKKLALDRGLRVYYYVKNSSSKTKLGIQVPKEVFDEVYANFQKSSSSRSEKREKRDGKLIEEATEELKRLFPRMPRKDAENIVERGWERYSGRVGRGNVLPLEIKLLLATWAYIRHSRTDYDEQLGPRKDNASSSREAKTLRDKARKDVRDSMITVWKKWGGNPSDIGKLHASGNNSKKSTKPPRIDAVSGVSVGKRKHNLLQGALQRSQYLEQKEKPEQSHNSKKKILPKQPKEGKRIKSINLSVSGVKQKQTSLESRITFPKPLEIRTSPEVVCIESDSDSDVQVTSPWDAIMEDAFDDDRITPSPGWSVEEDDDDSEFAAGSDEEYEEEYDDEDEQESEYDEDEDDDDGYIID